MDECTPRPAQRKALRRAPARGCSCDELLRLAEDPAVETVLGRFAVDVSGLRAARATLHGNSEEEPADWHARLRQRGAAPGATVDGLAGLLAIVRSADCHAYRLLERSGVSCARVRKVIIEHQRNARESPPVSESVAGSPKAAVAVDDKKTPHTAGEPEPSVRSRGLGRLLAGFERVAARPVRHLPRGATANDGRAVDDTSRDAAEQTRGRRSRSVATPARPRIASPSDRRPERLRQSPALPTPSRSRSPAEDSLLAPRTRPGGSVSARVSTPGSAKAAVARTSDRGAGGLARDDAQNSQDEATIGGPTPTLLRPVEAPSLAVMVGRDAELARLADAMSRYSPRPVLLIGEPGSGRTLLANHLATVGRSTVDRVDATQCEDEDGLRAELDAARERGGIVVLDDLDRVPGDGCPGWLQVFAHAWASASPRVVTVVSPEGRSRLESWLPNVSEIFDIIELNPIRDSDLVEAVTVPGSALLDARGLALAPDASLSDLALDADRWLGVLAMPGRALDLLDLACSRALRQGQRRLEANAWRSIIEERTGLSRERICGAAESEALAFESRLAKRVIGHEHAIHILAELLRRGRAGFRGRRPLVSALLVGPSGVGKTELAKAMAAVLFDRSESLIRLDMSEYAEAHAVARIVGAPPGYVGHEKGGVLTDALLHQPHCVVLLDEIEKAHRDVHQLLLQVLDEGWLTDGRGRRIAFGHCVLVMTSNLGSEQLAKHPSIADSVLLREISTSFPPELWNRIEAPLVLRALTPSQLVEICTLLVRLSSQRLEHERGLSYHLERDALDLLVSLAGQAPGQGARPLRHLLARHVESMLAHVILAGEVERGEELVVTADGDGGFDWRRSGRPGGLTRVAG